MYQKLGRRLITLGFLMLIAAFLLSLSGTIAVLNHVQALPSDGTNPVHITLIPDSPTLSYGEETNVNIYFHPQDRRVTATELRLNLDPNLLEFTSPHPITPATALPWVLPNCTAGDPPGPDEPCPATSSASPQEALIYLGVSCSESGCIFPASSSAYLVGSARIRSVSHTPLTTPLTAISATGSATLIAALGSMGDVVGIASATTLSLTACPLAFDLNPNQQIDVTDIMKVAAIWPAVPGTYLYNGQADLNHNHQIDVADIMQVAAHWSESCQLEN